MRIWLVYMTITYSEWWVIKLTKLELQASSRYSYNNNNNNRYKPRTKSSEGTPVETSNCPLCSEGRVPRICRPLLRDFFWKLVICFAVGADILKIYFVFYSALRWSTTQPNGPRANDGISGAGARNFFSGRGVWPGFPKCGACELIFASEKGGLWTEISKFGGLRTENFPGLWTKIWLRLSRLKFPNFLKRRGSCELTLLLEVRPLRTTGETWKVGFRKFPFW